MKGHPILACDKITMRVVGRYPRIVDAAKAYGISPSTVRTSALDRRVMNDTVVFRFIDDYDPNETFEGKKNRPVVAIADGKDVIGTFYSAEAAAESLFISLATVRACIAKGERTLKNVNLEYAR